jgi:hypothetical protein
LQQSTYIDGIPIIVSQIETNFQSKEKPISKPDGISRVSVIAYFIGQLNHLTEPIRVTRLGELSPIVFSLVSFFNNRIRPN